MFEIPQSPSSSLLSSHKKQMGGGVGGWAVKEQEKSEIGPETNKSYDGCCFFLFFSHMLSMDTLTIEYVPDY